MKVYVVKSYNWLYGIYSTKEKAEEAKKEANWKDEMSGGRGGYAVKEMEIQ